MPAVQLIVNPSTFVETARNRVIVARFVGQMAVDQLARSFRATLADVQRQRALAKPADAAVVASKDDGEAIVSLVSVEAPFADYDSLPAAHVIERMGRLDRATVAAVQAYEQQRRGRRTILAKADLLLASA